MDDGCVSIIAEGTAEHSPSTPNEGRRPKMKRARIAFRGRDLWGEVIDNDTALRLPDGMLVPVARAQWLPPVRRDTSVFALDASRGCAGSLDPSRSHPPILLKAYENFVGHDGDTPCPLDTGAKASCALVIVIGTTAKAVTKEQALDHVSGYTIACDYSLADKGADSEMTAATTSIGPWIVDARDIADPAALTLRASVNGKEEVHRDTIANGASGIASLIEYLSALTTLRAGDMILTGALHPAFPVKAGDTVICEIEGIGRLTSHPVAAS
jgi:5-oxopent-3-ene-1,2,5-tricarboxylate decarboxylase/2-hydroxyhepta-2,4-diene-1,7-dioate isomerase